LSLAVALVRDPKLLLLDEPHAGLDADGRETLDAVLAQAPSEGRTVVLVSHELERARTLADREVVISGGRVQPPAPEPATDEPADGSSNVAVTDATPEAVTKPPDPTLSPGVSESPGMSPASDITVAT
jgi:ABC-type multidrug transport system ATPase subunit